MGGNLQKLRDQVIAEAASVDGLVQIMEVCGTHTVSLFRSGIRSMLPANIRLISGPGCPVCVTAQGYIDAACELASRPDITICTYGDMLRVPGEGGSLAEQRARGAKVVVTYSAMDGLKYAVAHPDENIVFLAVGFETTTPATAAVVKAAKAKGVDNFTVFAAHKLVMPALKALLTADDVVISGFLCPGHVSVIIGADAYRPVTKEFHKPCAIAGFEPAQMLDGVLRIIQQCKDGRAEIDNCYGAVVSGEGNRVAWKFVEEVFEPADAEWRAIGVISQSGLELRDEYRIHDARARFNIVMPSSYEPKGCRCGDVIQGKAMPTECPLFAKGCTPRNPVGPCMVSSEGTCAAHYKYGNRQ